MEKINKKVWEVLFTPSVIISLMVIIGIVSAITGAWNYIEPLMGFVGLGFGLLTWSQTRKARQAVYADNGDGSWVVALEVGRPVSEAVKKQFSQLDALVSVQEVIGGNTLTLPEHYEKMARAVYAAICSGQGKNIHLILSGPVALSALIGQLIGLMHFQITVYQFASSSGTYEPMPRPTRDWLEHRG